MEKKIVMDQYPVQFKTFPKVGHSLKTTEDFINYFMEKIENDPKAQFIGLFDHLTHTQKIGGEINEKIEGAYNLVFCFGAKIPTPFSVAVRPRSIGIIDLGDAIQINFLQAPAEPVNTKMIEWVDQIK